MTWPVDASISTAEGAETETSPVAGAVEPSAAEVPDSVPVSVSVHCMGEVGDRDENSMVKDNSNDKIQRIA